MEPEVKIQLLKFCFYIVNTIFLVLGVSVAACALWILFDKGNLLSALSSDELDTVGAGLLLIGGLVLLVSVVGFAGANGEKMLLLVMYLGLLIVLLLGQLFVTLLLLLNNSKIEGLLFATVDKMIGQYQGHNNSSQDRLMDNIQTYGRCCGRTGPSDWPRGETVLPCSCFNVTRPDSSWCETEPGSIVYEEGCQLKISNMLQDNVLTIAIMDFGLMFLQVVQFAIVIYLRREMDRKTRMKGTIPPDYSDHAHMDHAQLDHAYMDHTQLDHAYTDHAQLDHAYLHQALQKHLDFPVQNNGYVYPEDGYGDPAPPYRYDNQNYY